MVVRDLDRMEPGKIAAGDREIWESRWKLLLTGQSHAQGLLREVDLQGMASLRVDAVYKSLRATFRLDDARGSAVLMLMPPAPRINGSAGKAAIPWILKACCHAGMPAAIWLRHPDARRLTASSGRVDDDDRAYLVNALGQTDEGQSPLCDLPRRVRSLRLQAEAEQQHRPPGPSSEPTVGRPKPDVGPAGFPAAPALVERS